MSRYSFVDEWLVPAPPEWVYGLLSCPRDYPGWWGDAFLRGEGDDGPAAPGKRARHLTPLLRPLFAWNHPWAMRRGQERIVGLPANGARAAEAVES